MKKKLLIFISLGTLLFPLILIVIAVGALVGASDSASSPGSSETVEGVTYVEHWSTDNAYTHNLLAHRYGIKADQIDGFLNSTGIKYDKSRINGKKVLEWEKTSGLDARAIVAIAEMESSLGTAGVATQKGANMFGYGAYDSNPDNASNFNDESAVTGLTKTTIIQNKNESFKIQDDKAKKNANGSLNTSKDGGVYFTDTSGTGKKRAEVMEKMDKWIDDHGGTPKPPKDSGSKSHDGGGVTSAGVPSGYSLTKKIDTSGYDASTYPWGNVLGSSIIVLRKLGCLMTLIWEMAELGKAKLAIRLLILLQNIQLSHLLQERLVLILPMVTWPLWNRLRRMDLF